MKTNKTRKTILTLVSVLVIVLLTVIFGISAYAQTIVRGDLNNDSKVDIDDAIYILRHTLMPNRYTITQSGDLNGDGTVSVDDAIYLLRHTIMPSRYPLACEHEIIVDPEVRPTCITSGLTEGQHCSICNVVLVEQTKIEATGHSFGEWHKVEANGCADFEYSLRVCSICAYVEYDYDLVGDIHPHDFEITGTMPTCTQSGEVTVTCKKCGIIGAQEILSPLGHNLNWILTDTTHSLKCVREGCDYKTDAEAHEADTDSLCIDAHCKVCNYFMREGISHILSTKYSSDEYRHWIECTRDNCNWVQSCGVHQNSSAICTDTSAICDICAREFVPNGSHGMGEWYQTKAPDCTSAGELRRDCAYCDYYQTMTIPATGHTMGSWYTTKSPTETTTGEQRRDCQVCDHYEIRTVAATGHKLGSWYITREPTCTSAGEKRRDCSHCGYYETASVSPLGHYCTKWYQIEAPTCTESGSSYGYCTRCGMYLTRVEDALDHAWSGYMRSSTHHWKYCTRCGVKGMYAAHSGGTNTCTQAAKCSACDYVYGQALGHNYATGWSCTKNTHYHICQNGCGTKKDEAVHNLVAISETIEIKDDGAQIKYMHKLYMVCSVCGYQTTECTVFRSEHYACTIMEAVEPTCTKTGLTWGLKCGVPGCGEIYQAQEVIPALGHNYVGGVCTRCGAGGSGGTGQPGGDTSAHTCVGMAWITVKQPTCTETGEKHLICSCGKSLKTATVPAAGHLVVTDAAKAPTCTEPGLTEGKHCYICGVTLLKQETIAAKGHSYGEWTQTKAPTCTEKGEEKRNCKNCEHFETREIDVSEHSYGEWTQTKAPTCTEKGEEKRICKNCEHFETREIDVSEHSYGEWTQTKAPTCTEKGEEKRNCKNCEHFEIREIEMVSHKYVDKICQNCGQKEPSEGLIYTLNSGSASYTVSGIGTCIDSDIAIPAKYNGKPVTSLGGGAFYNCTGLTSITIPNSVTSIGGSAFSGCKGLTSITIPNSVTSIGWHAFEDCTGLTSITIPNSVKSIGEHAFYRCTGLTSITIPNSVTSIGSEAFYNCTGLTSITIPNSVTSIGGSAFSGCKGLTSITIPNSVTIIGSYTFYGCSGLTSIEIPNSVTSIGYRAFYNCTGLTSVTIGNGVTSIGDSAFDGCTRLTSIYITDIASWCNISFSGSSSNPLYYAHNLYLNNELVTSLIIPNSVTSIGDYAFYGCTGLTSIEIPNSVTSIGDRAFRGCTGLTSVTIGNGVTSIGERAFYNCTGLTSITVDTGNTVYHSAGNCLIKTSSKILILGCKNSIIPDDGSVKSIGGYAFYCCTGLTSITIPNSVKSIGSEAFYNCTGLTSIEIPNSVTSIGSEAFWYCRGLTSVTIGNSVTSIGDYAFIYCTWLTSINFKGTKAQWNAIVKGYNWNYNTGSYTIYCTDGTISK